MITASESLSVWSGEAIKVSDSFLVNLQQSKKCTFILLHDCSQLQVTVDLWKAYYNKKSVMC